MRRRRHDMGRGWRPFALACVGLACVIAIAILTQPQLAVAQTTPAAFGIHVIDGETGRGIPCVKLTATSKAELVTDSGGWAAFTDPGLLGDTVWWTVSTDGYWLPPDWLGLVGFSARATPGHNVTIQMIRNNLAERLYRLTGVGIYRDSVLLGLPAPIKQPLLNAHVAGQDSVLNAVHNNQLYWFWGDTNKVSYPIGNFAATGAVSDLHPALPAFQGVNLNYFQDASGFVKPMTRLAGGGPVWLASTVELPNGVMVAEFERGGMTTKEWGFMQWNDTSSQFELLVSFDLQPEWMQNALTGHAFLHDVAGVTYMVVSSVMPWARAPATLEAISNIHAWEFYSPLVPGTNMSGSTTQVQRSSSGQVQYGWKRYTQPVGLADQTVLFQLGLLQPNEAAIQLRDTSQQDCYQPQLNSGTVHWNPYRNRFIMIATESFGQGSMLGEIWYADSPSLEGPWWTATKIITHNVTGMDFYNAIHHVALDEANGQFILLSATYTNSFGGAVAVPLYDYNNIMYRLDLSRVPVSVPVPSCGTMPSNGLTPWQWVAIGAGCVIFVAAVVIAIFWYRKHHRHADPASTPLVPKK